MSLLRASVATLVLSVIVIAAPLPSSSNLRATGGAVVVVDIAADATTAATVINKENAQLVKSMEKSYEEYGCLSSWGSFPRINSDDPQQGLKGMSMSTSTSTTRDHTKKLGMACMCGMLHDSALLMIEEFMFENVLPSSSSSSFASTAPLSLSSAIAAANSIKDGTDNTISTRPSSEQQQILQSSSSLSSPSFATVVQSLDLEKKCINGKAGEFECDNVDLIAHLPLNVFKVPNTNQSPAGVNDVWGWTHTLSGREFVLLGAKEGSFFIEVTDFANIKISGYLPSSNGGSSSWRDLKVIGDFVYIGSELADHGMQIFDLTRLLDDDTDCVSEFYCKEFTSDKVYFGTDDIPIGNTHNVVANPDTNHIYLVGGSRQVGCGGGLHIVDVSNPLEPKFVGCYSGDGYVHDAQCVVYDGPDTNYQGKEICFCFNEDTVTIVDVTDKTDIIQLSRTSYKSDGYTHQGWVSSDMKFVVFGDETDELDIGGPTRTLILNIEDLQVPTNFQEYFGTTNAIDHNLYIANAQTQGYGDTFSNSDLIYQANYRAGLRIQQVVDIDVAYDDPTHIIEVGYFDTFPNSNENKFNGAWSVYPYFSSGLVAISSVEGGLFLVKPTLNDVLVSEIDVDKPTYAPTNAPTNAPTDTPDPLFENLGSGYCRDLTGSYNDNWEVNNYCVDLSTCQAECKDQDQCVGVAWAYAPVDNYDDCGDQSLSRCVVYYSTVAPRIVVEQASGAPEEYTTYRYLTSAPVAPTSAPVTPTSEPTPEPTSEPTQEPTPEPTPEPTVFDDVDSPTESPTQSCADRDNYLWKNKDDKDCEWAGTGKTKKKKKKCKKQDTILGHNVAFYCRNTCAKVGVGPCKNRSTLS